jgi:menaquinone-dependent protoporphyrinogen IX oxidase
LLFSTISIDTNFFGPLLIILCYWQINFISFFATIVNSAKNMRKILKIVGIIIIAFVIIFSSVLAALALDLTSYNATATETLNPAGSPVGHAIVVYDPGFSGSAKLAATKIAEDLQAKEYTVDLAGVKSATAGQTSNYAIIVAGGPMYWGQAASSIEGYLKTLTNSNQTKLGVYVTTGSSQYSSSDFQSLQQQLASVTNNLSQVKIQMVLDGNQTQNCADLVESLLQ